MKLFEALLFSDDDPETVESNGKSRIAFLLLLSNSIEYREQLSDIVECAVIMHVRRWFTMEYQLSSSSIVENSQLILTVIWTMKTTKFRQRRDVDDGVENVSCQFPFDDGLPTNISAGIEPKSPACTGSCRYRQY